MAEITYQMVLSTIQTASLVVGIFYYVMTLRNTGKAQKQAIETRNTQFFLQLFSTTMDEAGIAMTMTPKNWDTFDEWWEQNGLTTNPQAFGFWFKQMYGHEMYGLMVRRGFIDVSLVDDLFSGGVLMLWDKYGPIIEELRIRWGYPHLQEHQEYLVNEIRKIVETQHPDYKGTINP